MTLPDKPLWKAAAAGVAGLALVIALLGPGLRAIADTLLERDAEQTALAWARHVVDVVPDLEAVLQGRPVDAETRAVLRRQRDVHVVFRFKLFDRDGRALLDSDDLDRPAGAAPPAAAIGHDEQQARVQALVLGGRNHISLQRAGGPGRPALYSEAYVPILRQGRTLGVVEVYVDQVQRAQRITAAFGQVALLVVGLLLAVGLSLGRYSYLRLQRQRQAEERARYLVEHDALSGLLNRASFSAALREATWRRAAGGPGFAVLCLDLDRFRELNDVLGQDIGDEVLRQVGERLQALVRQGDRVARLAGDEFAVLQVGGDAPAAAATLAGRIVETLARPFVAHGRDAVSGVSVGVALFGADAQTADELMHRAELALARAKSCGRGRFGFYDAALDEELAQRRHLTQELRAAIGSSQLSLYYQPLVAADGRRVTGYEALLRWQHPTRGALPPTLFVPLAEDSGLIEPLGRWVLRSACAAASRWPGALTVAVNLSPAQFRQGDLVQEVAAALAESGLAPQRLELEITESLLIANTEPVSAALQALSAMGVRIAMDDFGTGYSSLAYLWRFPFDKLKIDRAFTQHLGQDQRVELIVRAIISLAHALGIRVNAEGVETTTQQAMLRRLGCDELQGYLFGRPRPVEQIVAAALAPASATLPRPQVAAES